MKHMLLGMTLLSVGLVFSDSDALYRQGVAAYNSDPATACALFIRAADAGSVSAMAGAGHCYETGAGPEIDYAKAIDWYEKAVKLNSLKACEGLARIYASCEDPEFHDGEKAVKYASAVLRKKPRNEDALVLMASAFARNVQFSKAMEVMTKAGSRASADQAMEIQSLYKGLKSGTPIPAFATDGWLFDAAKQGSLWAMLRRAERCADELSMHHDYDAAIQMYQLAAEKGCSDALLYLGDLHFKCSPVQDLKKTIDFYEKARGSRVDLGDERKYRIKSLLLSMKYYRDAEACMEIGKKIEEGFESSGGNFDSSEQSYYQSPDPYKASLYYIMAYYHGALEGKDALSNVHVLLSATASKKYRLKRFEDAVEYQKKAITILIDYANEPELEEEYRKKLNLYMSRCR